MDYRLEESAGHCYHPFCRFATAFHILIRKQACPVAKFTKRQNCPLVLPGSRQTNPPVFGGFFCPHSACAPAKSCSHRPSRINVKKDKSILHNIGTFFKALF